MIKIQQTITYEKLLLGIVCVLNLFYIASCLFVPSSTFLIASFAAEAFYLYFFTNNKTLRAIYRDSAPLLSLVKVAIFCIACRDSRYFLFFLLIELYLLLFYRAGYYFSFIASSLPSLNYKNFGRLTHLVSFTNNLTKYQQAFFIRPANYLVVSFLIILPPEYSVPGIAIFLCIATAFTCNLLFNSFRFFQYIKKGEYQKDLKAHLNYHSPEVIVYVSGAPESSYQLAQWIPVLQQLTQRVTVIAREKFWISDIKDSPLHTVFARGMADLENFISQDTRICLYPANAFKNTQMMRRAELKHIFINHGESDKVVNVSRLISAYSKLYLAGPMAKDRLKAAGILLTKDQYAYVGRPQTSLFFKQSIHPTNTILYAPTWEGFDKMSNYNSVDTLALKIVQQIVEQSDYNIIFKPHPLTGTVQKELHNKLSQINTYLQESKRGSFFAQGNILTIMNQCDIMITDISSVMNDFLGTGKPYIVTNPSQIPLEDFHIKFMTVQGGYVVSHADEIINTLQSIAKTDPKKNERERIRKYSLGDFECSAMEKFQQEIEKDCTIGFGP